MANTRELEQTRSEASLSVRALRLMATGVRFFWLQLGVTLLVLVLLEVTAQIYVHAVGADNNEDPRVRADAYADAPWAKEVLREYNKRTVRWYPYVYWIGERYDSRYTHVDSNGIRATWRNPIGPATCERLFRIFMFGGSTTWGEGARDDYTIPSWLQRMFAKNDACVEVTNFGQDGYVSNQEVILLEDQLHRGNVPDLAIFYDGYNDAHSAALNDAPGLTYDEEARQREFNMGNRVTPGSFGILAAQWTLLAKTSLSQVVHSLGLGWFARRIVAKLSPGSYVEVNGILVRRPTQALAAADDNTLADATARGYLANVRIAEGIAKEFGFRCLFYWQPWLSDKYPLTPYEHQQMRELLPGLKGFVEAVQERVLRGNRDGEVHFLNDIFNNVAEPCFIDEIHVSEESNRWIAERIFPKALDLIEEIKAESRSNASKTRNLSSRTKVPHLDRTAALLSK